MKKAKAIIFDFNGTLFWDTEMHSEAWIKFSTTIRDKPLSNEEMKLLIGKNNKTTLEYIKGSPVTKEELKNWSDQKETCYREICLNDKKNLHLAPGAEELLEYLKQNDIPRAIASMAGEDNMKFYQEVFNLTKWFPPENIIYDTGDIPGKPDPAIYLKAIHTLGVAPEDCVIVEDSANGIEAAHRSGASVVFAIGPKEKHEELTKLPGVTKAISNFTEIDHSIFH
ncbi:hAD-superfamily hydrolase subfamily IA variant 3 [Histomonas meleagridis]|uniref:hAD-superfamily hydrolase subfamily IA variant 3 n=1 Tax=Histomonas meleagridis TaxID=135588 RepID=UPI003559F9BD|nr:hAD-superfamily hydrolase subfamily IA variant 3 [Histomonas meleagridis]KAH0798603.1 hAD-superfamily hydrolase subfamily IA variant 3 [Histomonas meleagridis]